MKTYTPKPADIKRQWYLLDAADKTLGRLASIIARYLQGKHKPDYTPHIDTGDYIIVINAVRIRVSGNKPAKKVYHRHSGFPGGLKSASLREWLEKRPEFVLESAVRGMLPKGPLGRAMFRKLKVYAREGHRHAAQQPIPLKL